MNWLALRLLRPYLIVAAVLSAASTAFVLLGARAIGRQVDAHGMVVDDYAPDRTGLCETGLSCLPAGTATDLGQAIVLIAAFVPLLIGLILGVPLFAREREESTDAFVLTQSIPPMRWLSIKLFWALSAGAVCTAAVAVSFRRAAAGYTLVLDDVGHTLLGEVHKYNVTFMVMQAVFITALAGVLGLAGGRTLRTLILSVLAWPVVLVVAQIGGLLLAMVAFLLSSWSDSLSSMLRTLDGDEAATFAALALAVCTVVAVLIGRRTVARTARRRP